MPTMISGFSGGGLADLGYMAAGYTPIGAVEFEPAIAEVYRANIGPHVRCESIMDTDWSTFDRPDLLHMSPECKEFSQAKTSGEEGPIQRAQAEAICRALETLTPRLFVLENVVGYRRSQSLARILATLSRLGYMYQLTNCNAADFGVPQTRRRLIVRAVRGGLVPHFPRKVRWVGWYEAIEDLLPTLPESAFAPWQLARLEPLFGDVLVGVNGEDGDLFRRRCEPAQTIAATNGAAKHRAFLVHPTEMRHATIRMDDEPSFTVMGNSFADSHAPGPRPRAFLVSDQRSNNGVSVGVREGGTPSLTVDTRPAAKTRAWLEQGRIVAMTPRALARFQSVPDSYLLPESRTLACTVIGNGVPSKLAQAIGASLLGAA